MTLEKHGTCLCGATRLKVTVDNTDISACHCSMCRKWTGGPLLVVHCSQPPVIEGRAPSVYESSDWAQRGFCGQCGTQLYATDPGTPRRYSLRVGTLAQRDQLGGPQAQIWTRRRVAWMPSLEGVGEIEGQP